MAYYKLPWNTKPFAKLEIHVSAEEPELTQLFDSLEADALKKGLKNWIATSMPPFWLDYPG